MFVVNCHEVTGGTEELTFDIAICGEFDIASMCGEWWWMENGMKSDRL